MFLYPLARDGIEARMLLLKDYAISRLEGRIGRKISYESVSPSIFRAFEIRNLRVRNDVTGTCVLEAGRLSVRYSLLGLLFGGAEDALREIVFENADLDLDAEADADLFGLFGGKGDSSGAAAGLSSARPRPRLTGRNISLRLRVGGVRVSAENVFFQLRPSGGNYAVRLKASLAYAGAVGGGLGRGGAAVDLRGTVSGDATSGETVLGVSGLSTDVFGLERQVFQLSFSPEGFLMRKVQDSAPLDFSLAYVSGAGEIRVDLACESFIPAGLVTLGPGFSSLDGLLRTAVSSKGSLRYRLSDGDLRYGFDFAADLGHPALPPGTRLSARLEGTRESVDFLPLAFSGPYGLVSFRGNLALSDFYPAGNLEVRDFRVLGADPLNASFRVGRGSAGIGVSGESISWGKSVFSGVSLEVKPSARDLRFDGRLRWKAEGGGEDGGEALVGFVLPLGTGGSQKLSLRLREVPAKAFYLPFAGAFSGVPGFALLDGLADDVDLRIEGTLLAEDVLGKNASFQAPRISVFKRGGRDTHIMSASGSYGAGGWELKGWTGRWGPYYGRGDASGDFLPDGRMGFSASVNIMDVPYSFYGTFDPDGYLHIDGNHGLAASLAWRPWGDYTGYFSLNEFPVPTLYDVMRISSIVNFRYADPLSWGLKTDSVRVTRFAPFAHIKADFGCAFDFGPGGGKLTGFRYEDSVSTLFGEARVAYSFDPLSAEGELQLRAGEDSVEQYGLSLAYGGGALGGKLAFVDSPLERFSAQAVTGKLSGMLDFAGMPENPRARLTLDSSQGKIRSTPASIHFDGRLENQTLSVSALELSYDTFRLSDTLVEYSAEDGLLSLAGLVRNRTGQGDTTWFLGGDFTFQKTGGAGGAYSFKRFLDSNIRGQMQFSTPSAGVAQEFRTWQFSVEKEGRNIRVGGGYNNSFEAFFEDSGNFSVHLKDPFPVTFEAEGYFRPDEMEANINRIAFRLDGNFSRVFDFNILRLTGGQVAGNLRVSGDPLDPDIYGTVAVIDGYAKLRLVPEELGPYRGNIIFREKGFFVQPMVVPVGDTGGSALVSGEFHLDHWMPDSLSVKIDSLDSPGVHIANNFGGLIIDGTAQGVLTVAGDLRNINVSGDIVASRTVITTGNAEDKPRTAGAMKRFTSVRMTVEAGSGVEIALPTVEFPIIQTFADRGEKIFFQWDEETDDFLLTGEVSARGGEIFWFDRRFFIREGTARFNERAGTFDPFVSVRAELRETTSDGLVRIYLVSDLTPASQFSPRFESDRGYTNTEILAVLGNNIFGTSGEDALNIASTVPLTGEILAQIGVIKTMEKTVRNVLNLDLFSVRTHVIQNLLQGAITPNRDQDQDLFMREQRNIPTFGRYLDKTSLFLGKYIGSDLFLNFLLQLRGEDVFAREEDAYGGLVLDAEFVLEWRTPFFLLEWSLMPKHPDELFIFDNVFTFRWRFAF
ncbi:MAG: translocation/assembly module TamB [Spirochaetia bacterium]|nr:translocation/assembly module TamB [Spirochaetia bacterium]